MEADVFRPQSAGRAIRTAFVLGVMIVVALIAAFLAVHQFTGLVGHPTKDELSRYLDDNQHSTASPGGAGFKVNFPVPASRQSESFSTGRGAVAARRDYALVDDEVVFEAVWFQVPGATPNPPGVFLDSLVNAQVHQLAGTRIGLQAQITVGHAIARDFVFVTVDTTGAKHYWDERIMLNGGHVWALRVGSRIRRDAAFAVFAHTFAFTS